MQAPFTVTEDLLEYIIEVFINYIVISAGLSSADVFFVYLLKQLFYNCIFYCKKLNLREKMNQCN